MGIEWSKDKFENILQDQVRQHLGMDMDIDLDSKWANEIVEGVVRDQINKLPFAAMIPDAAKEQIYETAGKVVGGFTGKLHKHATNAGKKVLDGVTWIGNKAINWGRSLWR